MQFPLLRGRSIVAALFLCTLGAVATIAQPVSQPPAPADAVPSNAREARFALIIGNDGYDNAPLPTAAQDAGLIADTLKAAGFDVMGARNVDQDTLRASYREFLQKVAGAGEGGVAFIYVSGYGVQFEGENYLIPAGSTVERETDLALNAIRISDLTRPMGSLPARVKMVVLDLAYKGPFGQQAQLAPGLAMVTPEAGMLVAFNAAPGTYAPETKPPYGSYAQALAEMMREGGLQLADVFDRTRLRVSDLSRSTQIPWEASLVEEPFVFFERKAGEPATGATEAQLEMARSRPLREMSPDEAYAAALARDDLQGYQEFLEAFPNSPYAKNVRGILAARREATTWQRAQTTDTPNAYWTYMRRYPRGPHVPDAQRRLRRLSSSIQPPAEFELVAFDVPPPTEVEEVYFGAPAPEYFDPVPLPAVSFYGPPSMGWWTPPPPPVIAPEDYYFLPLSATYAPPPWVYVPDYVYAPAAYAYPPGYNYLPFVAAPAVLIAAITAGRLRPRFWGGAGPFQPRILPPRAFAPRPLALAPKQNLNRQISPSQNIRLNQQRQQFQNLNLQRQQLQQRGLQQNPQLRNLQQGQNPQLRNLQQGQNPQQRNLQQGQNPQLRNLQQQQNPQLRNLQQNPQLNRQQQLQQRQQQQFQQRQLQQQQRQQLNQQRVLQRQNVQQQNLQRQNLQRQQFQQRQIMQQQQRQPMIQQRQIMQQRQPVMQQRQMMQQRQPAMRAPVQQFRAPVQQFRAPVQRSAPVIRNFRR